MRSERCQATTDEPYGRGWPRTASPCLITEGAAVRPGARTGHERGPVGAALALLARRQSSRVTQGCGGTAFSPIAYEGRNLRPPQVRGHIRGRADAMLVPQHERPPAGPMDRNISACAGPQSGPQLERHRAIREGLRRSDFDLKRPKLNVLAYDWQARGPGFESPMLHSKINLKSPPYGGFFDAHLAGGTQKGTRSASEYHHGTL